MAKPMTEPMTEPMTTTRAANAPATILSTILTQRQIDAIVQGLPEESVQAEPVVVVPYDFTRPAAIAPDKRPLLDSIQG
ncbi:MAG: hypothetical protein QUU85_03960, partial [Candidatus Eisenbacteria bacterium]|nr:hypothetical protein [Candidatus Eisenbacteria bacterium]